MNWRNIKEKIIVCGSLIIAIIILYLMPPIDTYNNVYLSSFQNATHRYL